VTPSADYHRLFIRSTADALHKRHTATVSPYFQVLSEVQAPAVGVRSFASDVKLLSAVYFLFKCADV
jgi:hypothetical protein